jgi:hypothetical protein
MERAPPGEDGGEDATGRRAWGEGAIERKFNGQGIAEKLWWTERGEKGKLVYNPF